MEKYVDTYVTVEMWLTLFAVCLLVAAVIMYLAFSWGFNNKRKQMRTKSGQVVIPNRNFIDVNIDTSGTLDDTFSSVKNQVGYIMNNLSSEGSLKILVATSAFDGCISHHLIHLLQELSRTTARIDLLEDVEQMNLAQAINSIKGHGVRIDNTYLITDNILIGEIADYDIIISAHSGIRSTYELLHGVVHELAIREK